MSPDVFWSKVTKLDSGCWIWENSKTQDGYGVFREGGRNGKHVRAHRRAVELTKGPIPDGMAVCHSCDNPPCCNPDHLFIATIADNNKDRSAKGRTYRHIGQDNPMSKLTDKQREELRNMRRKGVSYRKIAKAFGISQPCAHEICNGKDYSYRYRSQPEPQTDGDEGAGSPKPQS